MITFLKRSLGIDEIETRLKNLEAFKADAERNFRGIAQLMPDIRLMDQETYDNLRELGQLGGNEKTIFFLHQKKGG